MDVLCGGCGKTLTADDNAGGTELRCPYCGRTILVPVPSDEAAPAERGTPADRRVELADEFLTKARLALKKKLLVVCGSCGERLTVEQRLAGKVARCPACGG